MATDSLANALNRGAIDVNIVGDLSPTISLKRRSIEQIFRRTWRTRI